jgi:hypothetical protein
VSGSNGGHIRRGELPNFLDMLDGNRNCRGGRRHWCRRRQRHRNVEQRHADRDHGRAIVPALAAIANPGDGGARGRHKVGTALFRGGAGGVCDD